MKSVQNKFDAVLNSLNIKEAKVAVGVSGGADSLALALLLHNSGKFKVVALSVDHGLREESGNEALYVAELMQSLGIEHHILNWEGEKPSTGVEEAARLARYELLEKWCENNSVKSLFIAHHRIDQAETFLMRLQRGSGVYGLASMQQVLNKGAVDIVRPLLEFVPEELKEFLKQSKIKWVDDPHNFMDDFLRVRVRKLIPELEDKIGLSAERIADTAKRMSRVRDYLEGQVAKFVKANVKSFDGVGYAFSVRAFEELHEEIALRMLADLLKKMGGKVYSPRLDNLERLYRAMLEKGYKSQTLSDCEIIKYQSKFWIVPELKERKVLPKKQWEDFVEKHPNYKRIKVPHKLRLCLANKETIL